MLRVADVMTRNLITLSPADSLKTARDAMNRSRIRHLPIVSPQGLFVGMLSQRDLLRASVSLLADMQSDTRDQIESGIPISEAMTTNVLTVPSDMPLAEAGQLLLTHKRGGLPVLDDGELCGILTESDFVKLCITMLEKEQS